MTHLPPYPYHDDFGSVHWRCPFCASDNHEKESVKVLTCISCGATPDDYKEKE